MGDGAGEGEGHGYVADVHPDPYLPEAPDSACRPSLITSLRIVAQIEIEELAVVAVVVPESCPAGEALFPSPTGRSSLDHGVMIRTQRAKSQTVGCYYQGSEELMQEAIFGEGEALQHSAMTLRHAHQDGAAREGDRLRSPRG